MMTLQEYDNLPMGTTLYYVYIDKKSNKARVAKLAKADYKNAHKFYARLSNTPSLDDEATHEDLFRWHNVLTGSCRFGRLEFCKAHDLDPEQGTMTVKDFLDLTQYAYGGDAIRELRSKY